MDVEECLALRARLVAERERLSLLPRTSAYVAHRLKCVARALELLIEDECAQSPGVGDELAGLLGSLTLGS
jgi:hypothetical protein